MILLEKEKQMPWIDALKGIGILAVIAGHVLPQPTHDLVYTFHMPLFFLVSGYLFRPKGMVRLLDLARSLILPLITSIILILAIFWLVPSLFRGTSISLSSLMSYYREGNFVVLWFPIVLTINILTMEIMEAYSNRTGQVTIATLLLLASYANDGFRYFDPPLSAAVSAHTLAFVLLGRLAACSSLKIPSILIGVALLLIPVPLAFPNLAYDLWRGDLGIPVVSFVNACTIVLGLAAITKGLSVRLPMRYLKLLGRTSLVIMLFHQPIQNALRHQGMIDSAVRFGVVVVLCTFLGWLCEKSGVLGTLLLGNRSRKHNKQVEPAQ